MTDVFNYELLRLARESLGLTQTALAARASVTQTLLSKYESGAAEPTAESLEKIAKVLNYPPAFFYGKSSSCVDGLAYHRKRATLSAKVRARLEAQARLRMIDLETAIGKEEFASDLPRFENVKPEVAARKLRKHWKLSPTKPIENLVELLERNNVVVLQFDFQTDKIDGFFISLTDRVACFAENAKGFPPDRQRFTLCHELGHAVLHRNRLPGKGVEEEANLFAAEFLAPSAGIINDFPGAVNPPILAAIKRKWKISMAAALHRAFDLEVIDPDEYKRECIRLSAMGYRKSEPVMGVQEEQATLCRKILEQCAERSAKPLSEVLNLSRAIFNDRYPELAGGKQ